MRRRAVLASLSAAGIGALATRARAESSLLDPKTPRLVLSAGRSVLRVELPAASFCTIAVLGPPTALLGTEAAGSAIARRLRSHRPLDEDGLLPRTLSVQTDSSAESFDLVVDVTDPVEVLLGCASEADAIEPSPKDLKAGTAQPRPLVGFPAPKSPKAGYAIASPARYVFARIDVVRSLLAVFEKTRKSLGVADPIALSDASQWNGKRPKSDIGQPRHISHEGGVDIDIALPANDSIPSSIRDHCRGVRLETDRYGCSPGTAKGVDFDRLGFLIGTLADESPGRITKVFMDDVYRREVIRVGQSLRDRGLIKEPGLVALGEDGVIVASPWHTDHFHVRFSGEKGRSLF